jgi:hypothetical protein
VYIVFSPGIIIIIGRLILSTIVAFFRIDFQNSVPEVSSNIHKDAAITAREDSISIITNTIPNELNSEIP